jgi:hypothetical protein
MKGNKSVSLGPEIDSSVSLFKVWPQFAKKEHKALFFKHILDTQTKTSQPCDRQ